AKCGSIEKQVKVKITKVSSKPQPNPRPENPSHPSIKPAPTPDRSGNFVTQPSNEVSKNLPKEENKNLTKQEELKKRRFIDTENHWAKHAIDYVVEKGYFKGVGNDRFAPNKSITRGDFVTVLGRMAGIDQSKYTSNPFSDLENNYATAYIIWAAENDIVKGVGNGKFESNRPITREEMAVVMSRYLYVTGKTLQDKQDVPFNDQSDISPWAQEAVKDMAKKGIVQGMENRCFSPKTSFTRAQVAQVLYNIDKNSK
ncbi:S-layer homology domain-containing protein, partial [Peptoniphilus sp. HCN-40583]|uniref:S-layer homology domain-containing protein n=1 Tax=Peptoniphilus sp. HCN-40583 TaxID=3134662 RepID=UPI0030ECEFDA